MSALYAALCDLADARDERDEELRAEVMEERRRRARMNHWCEECRGHPGGPCDFGEPEDEHEAEPEGSEEDTECEP